VTRVSLPTLNIAVIAGGPGAEADVSRSSARGVAEALRETWPDVTPLELDSELPAKLINRRFDLVFPVLHGPPGEDGTVQGFLEILGIPYVGSGVLASACAMNKIVAKQIFRAFGLPVARDVIIERNENVDEAVDRVLRALPMNVVIKPVAQGSAIGVTLAASREELSKGLREALTFGDRVLVEERIAGKEVTCAVLDKPESEALTTIEVRTPQGSWYDFEHRYTQGLSDHIIPADISDEQNRRVMEVAVMAHRALGCRDLSRSDYVVPPQGEPILLEVNTIPGMTPTSLFPDAARASGYSFADLVRHVVLRAFERTRAETTR
jgi:D-alanine-D-alanine ligase